MNSSDEELIQLQIERNLPRTFEKGEEVNGLFRIESPPELGGMAEVYRAKRVTSSRNKSCSSTVAIKVMRIDRNPADLRPWFEREIHILKRLVGVGHVIQLIDSGCLDSGQLFMVTPWSSGNLALSFKSVAAKFNNEFAPELMMNIAREITTALIGIHNRDIIHRDISANNILFDRETGAVVCDFGISVDTNWERDSILASVFDSPMGTAGYTSPEQYNLQRPQKSTDIWSFGVIILEMVAGINPLDQYRDFFQGKYPSRPKDAPIKERLYDCAIQCLAVDPSKRPTAAELLVAIDTIPRQQHGSRITVVPDAGEEVPQVVVEREVDSSPSMPANGVASTVVANTAIPAPDGTQRSKNPREHRSSQTWRATSVALFLVAITMIGAGYRWWLQPRWRQTGDDVSSIGAKVAADNVANAGSVGTRLLASPPEEIESPKLHLPETPEDKGLTVVSKPDPTPPMEEREAEHAKSPKAHGVHKKQASGVAKKPSHQKRSPLSERECEDLLRREAQAKVSGRAWADVERLTRPNNQSCWKNRADWAADRMLALWNLERYEECERFGAGQRGKIVSTYLQLCRERR